MSMPLPPAAQFSVDRFKRPVRVVVSTVNVGTTPTRLVPNNPARMHLLAQNRSPSSGAIDFSQELTFASGFFVTANGGSIALTVEEDGEATGWEVWAIQQSAAGNWRVFEVIAL